MKLPQFRVRTLLLLTAIMGVVFVVCARWPVTDVPPPTTAVAGSTWGLRITNAAGAPAVITIKRPPTFTEWAIRAGIASAILLAVFVFVGAWRTRKMNAVAADVAPRPVG